MLAAETAKNVLNLKKKISAAYGPTFFPAAMSIPFVKTSPSDIDPETPLNDIRKSDSEENSCRNKEPLIIAELEKLMERIRSCRNEYAQPEIIGLIGSSASIVSCKSCGNKDPNNFMTDNLRGDTICNGVNGKGCGEVVQDHNVVQGAEKRNFEGEEDKKHFGPPPNKLMPDAENMKTNLNIQFFGCSSREQGTWKRLYQAHQNLEMNLSNIGNDDRRTRQGYKSGQIRQACALMEEMAANINVHQLVIDRAKEEFAKYREVRESVHNFEGCVAACITIAYEELLKEVGGKIHQAVSSFEVKQDIGKFDPNEKEFGVVLPHASVKDDLAICSEPGVPMGRFNLQQASKFGTITTTVMDWLYAVASSKGCSSNGGIAQKQISGVINARGLMLSDFSFQTRFYATMLGKYIANALRQQKEEADALGPAKSADQKKMSTAGMFGSVTMAGRTKQYKSALNGAMADSTHLTAGQFLMRARVSEVFKNFELDDNNELIKRRSTTLTQDSKVVLQQCERLFHEAIRRRAKYDAQKKESDRVLRLEQVRLQKEPDSVSTSIKPKASNNTSSYTDSNSNNNGNSSEEVFNLDEIDLEDLVGGSISTVVAPSKVSFVDEEIPSETASVEAPLPLAPIAAPSTIVGMKRPQSMISVTEEPAQSGGIAAIAAPAPMKIKVPKLVIKRGIS
eukprot:gene27011-35717_t